MNNNHGERCKCFTCGGDVREFIPVDKDVKDIYECSYCGNWYKIDEDGTMRYPNAKETIEASMVRRKRQDLKEQGITVDKCSITSKDFENSGYVMYATVDAMEQSDIGHATKVAINKALFYFREDLQTAEQNRDKE